MENRPAEAFLSFEDGPLIVGVSGYDKVLLSEAQRSALRARDAFDRNATGEEAGASAAAILCAAAACEAALSEYIAYEEIWEKRQIEALEQIRGDRDGLRQWKRLIKLFDDTYDFGSDGRYSALGCLFRLREHIAHRSAQFLEAGEYPVRLADCVRQGTIPVRPADHGVDWTSVIFVHEVAGWAAGTAAEWLEATQALLPMAAHKTEFERIARMLQEASEQTRRDLEAAAENQAEHLGGVEEPPPPSPPA